MNLGKLDDLGLEMGLSAIQDQVIPQKHATLGEFNSSSPLHNKWLGLGVLIALLVLAHQRGWV